jgi:hypothetical protein
MQLLNLADNDGKKLSIRKDLVLSFGEYIPTTGINRRAYNGNCNSFVITGIPSKKMNRSFTEFEEYPTTTYYVRDSHDDIRMALQDI